jgi:hypothetical protein
MFIAFLTVTLPVSELLTHDSQRFKCGVRFGISLLVTVFNLLSKPSQFGINSFIIHPSAYHLAAFPLPISCMGVKHYHFMPEC